MLKWCGGKRGQASESHIGQMSWAPLGTAILYLRVSTSEQALSGLDMEAQRATAKAYAARKGLTIIDEFCDEGISAKRLDTST